MSLAFDFDTAILADYLEHHVDGFKGPLTADKFPGCKWQICITS
jgi:hypothetical protein